MVSVSAVFRQCGFSVTTSRARGPETPIEEEPLLSPCDAAAAATTTKLSKIPGYNATRNMKLAPKVNGDPRINMQTPKPKSKIPNPKPTNTKPISG